MKRTYLCFLMTALVTTTLFAAPAYAVTKHVNCDQGQSLGQAIETAKGASGQLDIFVSGDCNENVTIRRSRVWISGDPYAVIHGRVNVFSATGVRLNNLEITGPGRGLVVTGGGGVMTNNLTLSGNQIDNLFLRRNSMVWLRNSTIVGDCEDIYDEDCADGAVVTSSVLEISNSTISRSRYGVTADNGSTIRLNVPGGGVTRIIDNSVVGVQAALHSNVELIGDTGFYGNRYYSLYLLQGSVARITSPEVHVDGNIGCQDWRSYLANPGGGYIGSAWCEIL